MAGPFNAARILTASKPAVVATFAFIASPWCRWEPSRDGKSTRFRVRKTSGDPTPLDEPHENGHHRQDEQDVDESIHGEIGHQAQGPEKQENDSYGPQHGSLLRLPSCAGLGV